MRIDHENHIIWFRQSGLDTYGQCPERARYSWFTDLPDGNSDATVTGSALHYGVEQNLTARKRDIGSWSTEVMIAAAKMEYDRIEETEGLTYIKGTKDDAWAFLETGIPAWRAYIEPYVAVDNQMLLEYKFDVHLMWWTDSAGQRWEIRLTGTMDCVDRYRIWDWKTAASGYKQWERQRWAVQPTVYAHACVELGLLEYPVRFSYGAVRKLKTKEFAEIIDVQRHAEHVDWLCQQINSLLILWDSVGEQGPWPLVDSHALCSEKWCPYWQECKGKAVPLGKFLWKPAQ